MVRNLPLSMLALLIAADGCARSPAPSLLLTPQTRFGLGEGYGPGITAVNARAMRFELLTAAHVIVLRVTEDGIEQVSPNSGRDPAVARGPHWVKVAADRGPVDVAGPDPADFQSGPGSLSCVPVLDPNLNAKPDPSCVERVSSRQTRPRTSGPVRLSDAINDIGYWLLIVSDALTPPDELKHRLGQIESADTPLLTLVQELPGVLVGGRTTNWAAYYVGFAEVPAPAR
jgi:hypothetical protein